VGLSLLYSGKGNLWGFPDLQNVTRSLNLRDQLNLPFQFALKKPIFGHPLSERNIETNMQQQQQKIAKWITEEEDLYKYFLIFIY
jgi:hypothetical protein